MNEEKIDKKIEKARMKGDTRNYAKLCDFYGRVPVDQSAFDRGLANLVMDEVEEQRLEEEMKREEKEERLHKYEKVFSENKKLRLNPDDVFSQINEKRKIIRKVMGYTKLTIKTGNMNLEDLPDEFVGRAYKNIYNQAKKAVEKTKK